LHGERLKSTTACKRPGDADSAKWGVDAYFETSRLPAGCRRETLPAAVDLPGLFEQVLRRHIALASLRGEFLRAQVERINSIRGKQARCCKLEARLQQEKQFNRKVELNRELRELQNEIEQLTNPQITQNDADSVEGKSPLRKSAQSADKKNPPHQNLWVNFGSGRSPS
jgi:hypothetical protein